MQQLLVPSIPAKGIVAILLSLGTALLIYWQPLNTALPLKASDVVFAVTAGLWLVSLRREDWVGTLRRPETWFAPALLASVLVGTLAGYVHYRVAMTRMGIVLLARLLLCIVLFLATYSLIVREGTLRRPICLAFFSPLVVFPVMLFPNGFAAMWDDTGRFQGLTPNPNTAAIAFLIAFALAYTLGAYAAARRQSLHALAFFAAAVGMLALIFWTGSRAYLAAALGSALLGTIFAASHHRFPKLTFALLAVSSVALIVAAILLLEPGRFTGSYLSHISRVHSSEPNTPGAGRHTFPQVRSLQRFLGGVVPTLQDDIRTPAIRYYSRLLATNPLGLGLNYESTFHIYHAPTRSYQGPNTILDLPLYGGAGAVLSVAYLGVVVWRRTQRVLGMPFGDHIPYTMAATAALAGLWVAALLVGSPIFDYQFWILTAIVLA